MAINRDALRRMNDSLLAAASGTNLIPWSRRRLRGLRETGEKQVSHEGFLNHASWASAPLPLQYKAAASVFAATGEIDLILDGLAVKRQVRQTLSRIAFRPVLYLLVLFFIAAVLLSFFSEAIVPQIESLRTDMRLTPAPVSAVRDEPIITSTASLYFLVGSVFIFIFILMGGTSRIVSWLGGQSYRMNCETAMVLRIAGRLIQVGVLPDLAIEQSCLLVRASNGSRRIATAMIGADSSTAMDTARQEDNARHFQQLAERQIGTLRALVPMVLVAGIGGAATLIYSVALFSPLSSLLYDLSIPTGVR